MNYACKLSELVKLNKCNSSGKNLLVLDLFQKSSDIRRLDFFLLKNRNTILEVTGIALHINLNFQYIFWGPKFKKFLLSYISGAVGGLSDIEVANEAHFKSYQNQTAEDIESGRARYERYTLMFFDT